MHAVVQTDSSGDAPLLAGAVCKRRSRRSPSPWPLTLGPGDTWPLRYSSGSRRTIIFCFSGSPVSRGALRAGDGRAASSMDCCSSAALRRARLPGVWVTPGPRSRTVVRCVGCGSDCRLDAAVDEREGVLRAGVLEAEEPPGLTRGRCVPALGCAVRVLGVAIAGCAPVRRALAGVAVGLRKLPGARRSAACSDRVTHCHCSPPGLHTGQLL